MKLGDFLSEHGLSQSDFAETIETKPVSVSRYVRNERLPEPEIMERIRIATNGLVTANDFYHPDMDQNT